EVEPVDPVAGHVPGARNAPAAGWVDASGLVLAPEALRARLEQLGVTAGDAVGAYCGSGVTASLSVLVLAAAGVDAALYTGWWSGWVSARDRPVAQGDEP